MTFTPDTFDWNGEDIVVPEQAAVAVYLNPHDHVVVRQEGRYGTDEDQWIVIDPVNALKVAQAILDAAGVVGDRLQIPKNLPSSPVTKPGNRDLFELAQGGVERDGTRQAARR